MDQIPDSNPIPPRYLSSEEIVPDQKEVKQSKKSIYTIVIFLFLLIFILFAASMIFLIRGNEDKIRALKNLTPEMLVTTEGEDPNYQEAKNVLAGLQKTLETGSTITEFKYNDWVMPNKTKSFIKGYTFSLGADRVIISEDLILDKYGASQELSDQASMSKAITELLEKSDKYFKANGFSKNIVNSSDINMREIVPEGKLAKNEAYEKNGLLCVASFNHLVFAYATFYCGVIDEEQNKLQATVGRELQPLLNPKGNPDVLIIVQKVEGDYATGAFGSESGGDSAQFYVKKEKSGWQTIMVTPNDLPCSVAREYEIPLEISAGCNQSQ